jgi:branched-chain amino acid aminotransferase
VENRLIYLNGQLVRENSPHISVLDRGFTLGDGVFDTMRAVDGRLFRLWDHLDRLRSSAEAIGLKMPIGLRELGEATVSLLQANRLSNALVRITVSRGVPAERGLLPPAEPTPCLTIVATPFAGYPAEWYERGYRATISTIRRNETSPLSRIKSCNYLDSVLARMEAGAQGAEEALMLNTAGYLACGASGNVFLVAEGGLVTPRLEDGAMDGITRRSVLELTKRMEIPHVERPVRPEEINLAQEIFISNTAVGIMPLVAVDGRRIGRGTPGPVARRLREGYEQLLLSAP